MLFRSYYFPHLSTSTSSLPIFSCICCLIFSCSSVEMQLTTIEIFFLTVNGGLMFRSRCLQVWFLLRHIREASVSCLFLWLVDVCCSLLLCSCMVMPLRTSTCDVSLCVLTPVRTPVWQNSNSFLRQNPRLERQTFWGFLLEQNGLIGKEPDAGKD